MIRYFLPLLFLLPAAAGAQSQCFESDGLQFRTTVRFSYMPGNRIHGTVISKAYDTDAEETGRFSGRVRNGQLFVRFEGKKPVVGAASEWRDKPWQLRRKGGKTQLAIIFYSKDYETSRWSETSYVFDPCGE